MLGTVIVNLGAVLGNGHRHINRFNGLITVGHLKGHRTEVAVGVGELACCQTHIGGTDICSAGHCIAAEYKVRIITRHCI